MKPIPFFKLQAKNLYRDYKTKKPYIDTVDGETYFDYSPPYFDVDRILLQYDWNEEKFSLMNAQHTIALMVGFRKWSDMLKASDEELELAKLLFDNQDKIGIEDWQMYVAGVENDNNTELSSQSMLEIFKLVFVDVDGHYNPFGDYRLNRN